MAVGILNQRQMRVAAKRLDRCYICGDPLHAASGNGPTSREHIISKAMRGPLPDALPQRWSPVLPVHRACEDNKARRDQLAKIVSVFGSNGPTAWTRKELETFRKVAEVRIEDDGEYGPAAVLQVGEELFEAAFLWVRGFHASLYGEVFPNPLGHFTRSPPRCSRRRTGTFQSKDGSSAMPSDKSSAWSTGGCAKGQWTRLGLGAVGSNTTASGTGTRAPRRVFGYASGLLTSLPVGATGAICRGGRWSACWADTLHTPCSRPRKSPFRGPMSRCAASTCSPTYRLNNTAMIRSARGSPTWSE
jgi:hypothetical protein